LKQVDVLAIAAHPDDVEISCGGLLLRMFDQGYSTGVLDLTRGELGTRGTPEIRAREAAAAAGILGLATRVNAELPDARLTLNDESRERVARWIRELRPALVILPSRGQRHPDHNAAHDIAYAGIFAAGLRKFPVEGNTHRPDKILYAASDFGGAPTFCVDITAQMERKLEAISAYESQFGEPAAGSQDVQSLVVAAGRYQGSRCGVTYAEGYRINEPLRLDDPLKELRLKSI
jgi:bacillithiol biosynthesis deacetylase BshB1